MREGTWFYAYLVSSTLRVFNSFIHFPVCFLSQVSEMPIMHDYVQVSSEYKMISSDSIK
jgi:hypothetical protein